MVETENKVLTEEELEDSLAELIDGLYPEYEIGYLRFSPSKILRQCDPIAWRCELAEHADALHREHGIVTKGYTD